MAGLDRETLDLVLASIVDFAKQNLPPEVLLDHDARFTLAAGGGRA